jgi:hypothetical protein
MKCSESDIKKATFLEFGRFLIDEDDNLSWFLFATVSFGRLQLWKAESTH